MKLIRISTVSPGTPVCSPSLRYFQKKLVFKLSLPVDNIDIYLLAQKKELKFVIPYPSQSAK
jgi:hypothetical protein